MGSSPDAIFYRAREAISAGRLDDAHLNIEYLLVNGYWAGRMARKLVSLYLSRAEKFILDDDTEAAWQELLAAESLSTGQRSVLRLRYKLKRLGIDKLRALSAPGLISAATDLAHRFADRGASKNYIDDQIQLAQIGREAASAIEHKASALQKGDHTRDLKKTPSDMEAVSPSTILPLDEGVKPASTAGLPRRFLLWIDGPGGGHLVCLGSRVTFGQAGGDGPIDVPVRADISRLHAEVSRDGEGYVLESGRGVLVNGAAASRAVLAVGDRVTLGSACQFCYRKPIRSSATARLELTSDHRLPIAVNGVLLMANELILGPAPDAHIVLPGVTHSILIYRSKEGLSVRIPGQTYRVNDQPVVDRAALPIPSQVVSEEVTFAVELSGSKP